MTILLRFYLMNQTLAALDKNEEVIYDTLPTTLMLSSMTSSTSLNTPSYVYIRNALYKKIYSGHTYIWDPRVVLSLVGLLISLQRLWILELVRLQNNVLNPPHPQHRKGRWIFLQFPLKIIHIQHKQTMQLRWGTQYQHYMLTFLRCFFGNTL